MALLFSVYGYAHINAWTNSEESCGATPAIGGQLTSPVWRTGMGMLLASFWHGLDPPSVSLVQLKLGHPTYTAHAIQGRSILPLVCHKYLEKLSKQLQWVDIVARSKSRCMH